MSDRYEAHRALHGCEARSDWLTYIINTIEAVSRQRLLQFEIANFQAHPSTAEEQRLFDIFVRGEERQIEDAREEMAAALQDIVDIGENYVESLHGVEPHLMPTITSTSAEAGRHVPIIGPTIQAIILDMALRAPGHQERARFGMTTAPAPAHGGPLQNFGAESLRRLIAAQRRGMCTCGSQVEQPRHPSGTTDSEVSDAAATRGSTDSVEDDYTIEKDEVVADEDVDYEAVSRQIDDLLRLSPDAPMSPEQRQHRTMAQQFESIVTEVNEAVLATPAGWTDDETRIRAIESRLREVLASMPLGFMLDIGRFCNDLALVARREQESKKVDDGTTSRTGTGEHIPAGGEAGPSTGPGSLPRSNQEHQASVEDAHEDSPDPASIPLPDSLPDSAYGSMSETGSEHHRVELD